jgi:hypothetical protein
MAVNEASCEDAEVQHSPQLTTGDAEETLREQLRFARLHCHPVFSLAATPLPMARICISLLPKLQVCT